MFDSRVSEHKLSKSKTTVTLGQIYNNDENAMDLQKCKSESNISNSDLENSGSTDNSDSDVINILTISDNSYCISYINDSDSAIINYCNDDIENGVGVIKKVEYSPNKSQHLNVESPQNSEIQNVMVIEDVIDNSIDDEKNKIDTECNAIGTISNIIQDSECNLNLTKTSDNNSNNSSANFNRSYVKDTHTTTCNDNLKIPYLISDKVTDEDTRDVNVHPLNLKYQPQEYNDDCKNKSCSNSDINKNTPRNENDMKNESTNENKDNILYNPLSTRQKECPETSRKSISAESSSIPLNGIISRRRDDENWKEFLSKLDKIIVSKSSEFL